AESAVEESRPALGDERSVLIAEEIHVRGCSRRRDVEGDRVAVGRLDRGGRGDAGGAHDHHVDRRGRGLVGPAACERRAGHEPDDDERNEAALGDSLNPVNEFRSESHELSYLSQAPAANFPESGRSVTRLTGSGALHPVPWLCVPGSRRVCSYRWSSATRAGCDSPSLSTPRCDRYPPVRTRDLINSSEVSRRTANVGGQRTTPRACCPRRLSGRVGSGGRRPDQLPVDVEARAAEPGPGRRGQVRNAISGATGPGRGVEAELGARDRGGEIAVPTIGDNDTVLRADEVHPRLSGRRRRDIERDEVAPVRQAVAVVVRDDRSEGDRSGPAASAARLGVSAAAALGSE